MAVSRITAAAKLASLRTLLRAANCAAIVVPTSDPHNSEYVADAFARREFISGFTGSAGTAVVTLDDARCWTDGRYFSQAATELDASAGWQLMKDRLPETPSIEAWLVSQLKRGDRVAIDPYTFPVAAYRRLASALGKAGISLYSPGAAGEGAAASTGSAVPAGNLIDAVWGDARPRLPSAPIFPHALEYAGKSVEEKLEAVRAAMAAEGASALVVTALDEVAWLFNLRGADVECNPVFLSYAIVTPSAALLFTDASKLTAEARKHLGLSPAPGTSTAPATTAAAMSPGAAHAVSQGAAGATEPASPSAPSLSSVRVLPYSDVSSFLAALPGKVWLDPTQCNYALFQAALSFNTASSTSSGGSGAEAAGAGASSPSAGATSSRAPLRGGTSFAALAAPVERGVSAAAAADARVLEKTCPITLMKSLKNPAEIEGMRQAHMRDAVALVTFLSWLEAAAVRGVDMRTGAPLAFKLTEYSAAQVLDGMRAQQPGFVSLSFPTIAGFRSNGAIIHYRPSEEGAAEITGDGMMLLDSGGQYRDGTTDVTRTLRFGTPTPAERLAYTRVLQGHINMSLAVFPSGTSGIAIDAMARAPLWASGLDYRHGTGHGVGAFLNVHEGPQYVANAVRSAYEGGLQLSMTITDEPGYYEDGAFGIRIENVLITTTAPTPHTFGGKPYLSFEPLTLVPIATGQLIDRSLLEPRQVEWLNAYHARVRAALTPLLRGHALEYLLRETEPLA